MLLITTTPQLKNLAAQGAGAVLASPLAKAVVAMLLSGIVNCKQHSSWQAHAL